MSSLTDSSAEPPQARVLGVEVAEAVCNRDRAGGADHRDRSGLDHSGRDRSGRGRGRGRSHDHSRADQDSGRSRDRTTRGSDNLEADNESRRYRTGSGHIRSEPEGRSRIAPASISS